MWRFATGRWPSRCATGASLPSESELASAFGVSRGIVRQAFALLRAQGLIVSRRGARRVVNEGERTQGFAELISFSAWARSVGEVPGGRVVELLPGIDMSAASVTDRLAELGVVLSEADHRIDAVAALAQDAALLDVGVGAPLLRTRRRTTDQHGKPVEWSADSYRGDVAVLAVHNSAALTAPARVEHPA